MLLPRLNMLTQRKPRDFNYKPMYVKDEDLDPNSTSEGRIRAAYGSKEEKSIREKMEDRRHFGGTYDHEKAKKKLYFLAVVLIAILIWIFLF